MTGIAPSGLSAVASASNEGGTFAALKEGNGKGKGPGKGDETPVTGTTPTTGTTPSTGTTPDADEDAGPGKNQTQIEGMTTEVTGTCPALTILINGQTVQTDETTDFQRGTCEQLLAGEGFRVHIAGSMHDTSFVASYVRIQGRKPGDDEDEAPTPPA